jgi:hypothetical protein
VIFSVNTSPIRSVNCTQIFVYFDPLKQTKKIIPQALLPNFSLFKRFFSPCHSIKEHHKLINPFYQFFPSLKSRLSSFISLGSLVALSLPFPPPQKQAKIAPVRILDLQRGYAKKMNLDSLFP